MRNHYVPEFLQNAWISQDGRLHVFRIADGETVRRSPKSNGFKHDMLSLTRDDVMGMDRHQIEEVFLQGVDNEAGRVCKRLIARQLTDLSHSERCAWVRFIMSLRLRQPELVVDLRVGAENLLRQKLAESPGEYEAGPDSEIIVPLEEWTEAAFPGAIENFGLSFFHELINDENIGTKILQLRWWVWDFSASPYRLILGDNPVVFAGGIDDPNLAIMLPISPTKAFIATRGQALAEKLVRANSKELSAKFNDASVRQAVRYVYSVDGQSDQFIKNRRPQSVRRRR